MNPSLPLVASETRRILMTTDALGGIWTYALELVRALEPHGVEVVMALMGPSPSPEQREEADAIPNLELRESGYKLEWMPSPWSDVAAAGEWLLQLEGCYRPDLIHLNGYVHGSLPWQAPLVVVGHWCVLSWWRAVHGRPAPAEWNRYREAVVAGLHAADLVVAPSQWMMAALVEHYGPLPRTRVIANGRKLPSLPPQPKEELVLTAGREWDQAKNVSALSAIAPTLPWPVYAAGDPAAAASSPCATGGLQHLGRLNREQLLSWLARAPLFVLPARYEPFGLTPLEAALAGCALVLGDIPSLREIWADAAWFVSPEQPETLGAALQEFIAHPAWLTEMADRARAVASYYAPDRMAASYMLAYRHVRQRAAANTTRVLAA